MILAEIIPLVAPHKSIPLKKEAETPILLMVFPAVPFIIGMMRSMR
jgi:hypothetical protein